MAFRPLTNPRRVASPRKERLVTTTVRAFDGGWNVIDTDLNLSSKFAKVLKNIYRSPDGSNNIRWGTRLFATNSFIDTIINCTYFNNFLICVGANGYVTATDGTGETFIIWDEFFAASLPGSPAGWTATSFVSFAQFKGELIICNGINKPLIVRSNMVCEYLYDLGTGGNVNTPIARYVTTSENYTVMAGDSINPSLLYISNSDTSGTWPLDSAPNDAITLELGPYVQFGDKSIKGIGRFRDKLVAFFEQVNIVITLGIYTDSVHTPSVDDVIPNHGAVSHRSVQSTGNDMLFSDIQGVASVQRALFTEQLRPDRPSQLIDPEIQRRISALSTATLEDRVFSVFNRREGQYMLFVPNASVQDDITETICFVYTNIEALKVKAWSEFRDWNWRCGCVSAQGRVFFAQANRLYVYGSQDDPIYADELNYEETWSDGTIFSDGHGFQRTVDTDNYANGLPVLFDWQLPWADFDERTKIKTSRHLAVETEGTGPFTVSMFVDNFLTDPAEIGEAFTDGTRFSDGYGFFTETPVYTPELSLDFRGNQAAGFGVQPFGNQYFGAGRRSSDERVYAWTSKFKIMKLRVHGETKEPIKFISLSLDYLIGSIRR